MIGDMKGFYRTINLICHSYTTMSNVFIKTMQAHYSFHMIRGDNTSDLSLYFNDFEHIYEVFDNAGDKFCNRRIQRQIHGLVEGKR